MPAREEKKTAKVKRMDEGKQEKERRREEEKNKGRKACRKEAFVRVKRYSGTRSNVIGYNGHSI